MTDPVKNTRLEEKQNGFLEAQFRPCPFCGCHASMRKDEKGNWFAECGGCGCEAAFTVERQKEKIVERWNRRWHLPEDFADED